MTARTNDVTTGDRGAVALAELTIAAGIVRALVDVAVARGASRADLLRRAAIHEADLANQDGRVPLERYVVLVRAAESLCGDPALALHFGEEVDLSQMSILGHLDHGVKTVGEGFGLINRFANLTVETGAVGPRLQIERRGREVWLVDTRPNPNAFPELTESTFARMVCGSRRVLGEQHSLLAVHVTHAAPAYRSEYERVFRAPVVFESDRNALRYDAAWWEQPIVGQPPYVSGILVAHAERLLDDLERSKTTRGRVEQILRARLSNGEIDMATIAAQLGLSRQTLLRRLRTEGVNFAQVLAELRRSVAAECLEHGLSVSETAYRVGFSDPAPFSRAFKRWTGESPRSFVAKRRNEPIGRR